MKFEDIKVTTQFLRNSGIDRVDTAIVLGTGLGGLTQAIEVETIIEYKNIPFFPLSTVESHAGRLIYGLLEGRKVLAMQGRFHYYEGYSMAEITFPIRVMKSLGAKELILSNAAGSMNSKFKKGSIFLIEDHLNFLPENPLRGLISAEYGPRFPDMSCPYSQILNGLFEKLAKLNNIELHKGVYVAVSGPNLETRAEYRMFRQFADVVGMSTVPEVIVANQIGLPCAALSVITDECDPDNLHPVTLSSILDVAAKAEPNLILLIRLLLKHLDLH